MGTHPTPNTARYRDQGRGLRGMRTWASMGGRRALQVKGKSTGRVQRLEMQHSNRLHLLRAGSLAEDSDTWKLATRI